MNKYLEKIAAKKKEREVGEHQRRVLEKLDKSEGVIVAHTMGSGKTLTSLLAAEKYQAQHPKEDVIAVVPASLATNMDKEIKKHKVKIDKKRFHVVTYDKAVNNVDELLKKKTSLVILDEAHRIRNKETARHTEVSKLVQKAKKRMLLTGTPSYNSPHDIAVLVNQAAGKKVLPENSKEFDARFIDVKKVNPGVLARLFLRVKPGTEKRLKNQKELQKILSKYMDTYNPKEGGNPDFPKESRKTVEVPMSERQEKYYNFLEGSLPAPIKWKIRMGLPLDKKESASLNAFSTGVRQVSNSIAPYVKHESEYEPSPKIRAAAHNLVKKHIQDPNFRGVVYSNYLDAGLKDYSRELSRMNVPHAIYHGGLTQTQKDEIKNAYNEGKLKTLLLSSSGAEGVDLKGTKLMQILEPHFNRKKIEQVIGRGSRFKSHEHLPDNERHVEVEEYLSVHKPTFLSKITKNKRHSIDEYLHHYSNDKEKIINEMVDLANPKKPKIEKQASEDMNKYIEKIAEKSERRGSWIVPAAASTIPIAAMGIARHHDLNIDIAHSKSQKDIAKFLEKSHMNKRTTAALAALGVGATGIAEYSRRRFMTDKNQEQANQIVKKIESKLQVPQ